MLLLWVRRCCQPLGSGKAVPRLLFAATAPCSKRLKEMMEHATQFPEEYSKVSSVQKKVRQPAQQQWQDQYKRLASCKYIVLVQACVHILASMPLFECWSNTHMPASLAACVTDNAVSLDHVMCRSHCILNLQGVGNTSH